jgi:hypothetical protein
MIMVGGGGWSGEGGEGGDGGDDGGGAGNEDDDDDDGPDAASDNGNGNGDDDEGGTREMRTSMQAPWSEYLTALLTRHSRLSVKKCLSVMIDGQINPCARRQYDTHNDNHN